jgi:hypothetical protein
VESYVKGVCLCNGCNEKSLKLKCQSCKNSSNYFCEIHRYHIKHRGLLLKTGNINVVARNQQQQNNINNVEASSNTRKGKVNL